MDGVIRSEAKAKGDGGNRTRKIKTYREEDAEIDMLKEGDHANKNYALPYSVVLHCPY